MAGIISCLELKGDGGGVVRVVSAEQMRQLEKKAINEYGIPGILLMENAALAVVQEIRQYFADKHSSWAGRKVVVLAGKGNNGGDGLAIARHLSLLEMEVSVFLLAQPREFQGDAALNLRLFQGMNGKCFVLDGEKQLRVARLALSQAEVVVDAMYGTGLRGALPSFVEEYVEEVNRSPAWVIAVDIASGVEADTGKIYNTAVRADTTVTFGLPKLGHFLNAGLEHSGRVIVDSISIPAPYLEQEAFATFVLTDKMVRSYLPARKLTGHKGTHGRGVLVAGSKGMSGAAILAGRAALRSGIGLIQTITPRGIAESVDAGIIEGTTWAAPGEEMLDSGAARVVLERMEGAQALAVGPGLGQNPELYTLLREILNQARVPLVIDADALNVLASDLHILVEGKQRNSSIILTPHPGEMARLCSCTVGEVQANRLELAVSKAVEWGVILVLKGAVTIIASPDGRAFLNPTGNPGLGTGGTGDVLTGSLLAWLAQGVEPVEAACLGVYLHGRAADILAGDYGWSGFSAAEVADTLPKTRKLLETAG